MHETAHLSYLWILAMVFARQLCLPLPAPLILMAAGAMAAGGGMHVALILAASVLGCLAADGIWFWMGRRWGSRVVRIICKLSSDPKGTKVRAHRVFNRWGIRLLAVAKFIPVIDGVMPPLAGAEGIRVSQFVLFDGIGAFLWTSAYVMIGAVFHEQLNLAIARSERFGSLIGVVFGAPLLAYIVWRAFVLLRMMRYLRSHRLSASTLDRMQREGERLAIIDLLGFEDCEEIHGIPGAARIDPARMRATGRVSLPEDLSIVVYCSSRRQIASARVVLAMRRKGVANVWILDGGLASWRAAGLPVTTELSSPEEMALMLGLELPEIKPQRRGRAGAEIAEMDVLPG